MGAHRPIAAPRNRHASHRLPATIRALPSDEIAADQSFALRVIAIGQRQERTCIVLPTPGFRKADFTGVKPLDCRSAGHATPYIHDPWHSRTLFPPHHFAVGSSQVALPQQTLVHNTFFQSLVLISHLN